MIRSTCFSCSGLGFGSQYSHNGSQHYVVLDDTSASSGLHRHKACMWHIHTQANKTLVHINIVLNQIRISGVYPRAILGSLRITVNLLRNYVKSTREHEIFLFVRRECDFSNVEGAEDLA